MFSYREKKSYCGNAYTELKEKKSKRKDVVFDTLQRIYNEGK